jgi:transporter family protein
MNRGIKMPSWIVWSLLALVTWGLWGFFPKLAVNYISPKDALIYDALGTGISGVLIALCIGGRPAPSLAGATFAALTGLTAILGGLFYLYAAREANISVVVVLTALYPIVTVLLAAIFLKESLTQRQILSLLLALAAIIVMATDPASTAELRPDKNASSPV